MENKVNKLLKEAKATFYTAKDIKIIITLPRKDFEKVEEEIRKMYKEVPGFSKILAKVQAYDTITTADGTVKFKQSGE